MAAPQCMLQNLHAINEKTGLVSAALVATTVVPLTVQKKEDTSFSTITSTIPATNREKQNGHR